MTESFKKKLSYKASESEMASY